MNTSQNNWHTQETYRSMIEYGRGMLRFGLVTNGGGILAILTFIGDLNTKAGPIPNMVPAIYTYICGVLLAGVAGITTYVVQLNLYGESRDGTTRHGLSGHLWWLRLTLILIVLSVLAFAGGSILAAQRLA